MIDFGYKQLKDIKAKLGQFAWRALHQDSVHQLASISLPNAGILPCIWINPSKLAYKCQIETKQVYQGLLFHSGDWDLGLSNMQDHESVDYRYITCNELLIQKLPLNQTTEYRAMISKISKGEKSRGFDHEPEILNYLNNIHSMYKAIQADGRLKTQLELGKSTWGGEINCAVGRGGELLKSTDGHHRLAVARVLGLDSIPVQVSRIHADLLPHIQGLVSESATEAINIFLKQLESKYS
jgi:hypothetical protein